MPYKKSPRTIKFKFSNWNSLDLEKHERNSTYTSKFHETQMLLLITNYIYNIISKRPLLWLFGE